MGSGEQHDSETSTKFRSVLVVSIVLGLVVPFVVLLIQQFTEVGDPTIPCCDYAVLEMGTRSFLRGEQLVGLYSREGWRHPGPVPFIWSAPFSLLPFRGFAKYQIAVVVMHMVAFGVYVAAIARRVRPTSVVALVALCSFFVWRFDVNQFREPWNPYMAMSLGVVALVAAARVFVDSSGAWLVVFALAGSMAVQTHLGSAPLVGGLLILLVVMAHRGRLSVDGKSVKRAGVVTGALWLLPLIDLVVGDHNFFEVFRRSGDGPDMSLRAIGRALVWMMSLSPDHLGRFFGTSSPFIDGGSPTIVNWLITLVSIGGGAWVLTKRHSQPFLAWMVALAFGGILLTTGALVVADGPFIRYLMLPMFGLSLVVWTAIVLAVAERLSDNSKWLTVSAASVFGLLATFSVSGSHLSRQYSNELIETVVTGIRENCDDLPDRTVVNVDESVSWADAVAFVDQMDRCTDVRVTRGIGFIAGQGFEASSDDIANVRIGMVTDMADSPGTDIASWNDIVVRVLDVD